MHRIGRRIVPPRAVPVEIVAHAARKIEGHHQELHAVLPVTGALLTGAVGRQQPRGLVQHLLREVDPLLRLGRVVAQHEGRGEHAAGVDPRMILNISLVQRLISRILPLGPGDQRMTQRGEGGFAQVVLPVVVEHRQPQQLMTVGKSVLRAVGRIVHAPRGIGACGERPAFGALEIALVPGQVTRHGKRRNGVAHIALPKLFAGIVLIGRRVPADLGVGNGLEAGPLGQVGRVDRRFQLLALPVVEEEHRVPDLIGRLGPGIIEMRFVGRAGVQQQQDGSRHSAHFA